MLIYIYIHTLHTYTKLIVIKYGLFVFFLSGPKFIII